MPNQAKVSSLLHFSKFCGTYFHVSGFPLPTQAENLFFELTFLIYMYISVCCLALYHLVYIYIYISINPWICIIIFLVVGLAARGEAGNAVGTERVWAGIAVGPGTRWGRERRSGWEHGGAGTAMAPGLRRMGTQKNQELIEAAGTQWGRLLSYMHIYIHIYTYRIDI